MVTVMFVGMSLSLPLSYYQEWKRRKPTRDAEAPLLEQEERRGSWREAFMLAIPTGFDLVATVLMNVGLVSVTASVYQMLRGAEMLFAALFSVIFLGRKLNKFHYSGILCCLAGISLVGAASLLGSEGSSTRKVPVRQMAIGMCLIIASQSVQAAQITYEDFFMADLNIAPLKIVGFEGVWGSLAMFLVVLPSVYFIPGREGSGLHEDSLDTLHMIMHNRVIWIILLVDMAGLLMYNYAGMCVTGNLGAVFRTVLETMRTLFVWLVDLLLFYTPLGYGKLGESWNNGSYIQAAGFVVLVCGALIYARGDEKAASKGEETSALVALNEEPHVATQAPPVPRPRSRGSSTPAIAMSPKPSVYKSTMNLAGFSPQTPRNSLPAYTDSNSQGHT
eukprot:SM000055S18232  [mRNA]  locus=s55:130018:133173:- [translate_table: standard]